MGLDKADRLARLLDDPRLDVRPREPLRHLLARERLVIPVATYLRIGMPGDEPVDVFRARRAERRQLSVYANFHTTSVPSTVPPSAS